MAILLVMSIASLLAIVGRFTEVFPVAIAFLASVAFFLKILVGSSIALLCFIIPVVTVASLGTIGVRVLLAPFQGLLRVDAIKTTNSEFVKTEALLVGVPVALLAQMSLVLFGSVASLGTVVIFVAVFVVKGIMGALAILPFAAIALFVAIGLSTLVGIAVIVFSLLTILICITVASFVIKAVFAERAMSVMTIARTVTTVTLARATVKLSRAVF